MILILAVQIAQFTFKVVGNANYNAFRVLGVGTIFCCKCKGERNHRHGGCRLPGIYGPIMLDPHPTQ